MACGFFVHPAHRRKRARPGNVVPKRGHVGVGRGGRKQQRRRASYILAECGALPSGRTTATGGRGGPESRVDVLAENWLGVFRAPLKFFRASLAASTALSNGTAGRRGLQDP